jgi:signal transduction histidine kinase
MPATTQSMVFDLLIAKYIIEAHGGALWIDANVGRENTFSFVLPA